LRPPGRTTLGAVSWRKPIGTWITSPVGSRHCDFSARRPGFLIPPLCRGFARSVYQSADDAASGVEGRSVNAAARA